MINFGFFCRLVFEFWDLLCACRSEYTVVDECVEMESVIRNLVKIMAFKSINMLSF